MKHRIVVYIDESVCNESNIASLTGIFIPFKRHKKILSEFYEIINKIISKFPKERNGTKIIYPAPYLHGNSFLRNSKENKWFDFSNIDDSFRIEIIKDVIELVKKNKLIIARLGYNNFNEIRLFFRINDKLQSLNWFGLSRFIDQYLKNKEAICVMDGSDYKIMRLIGQEYISARTFEKIYPELKSSLTYKNLDNIIGNVYFIPARFCEFLQIVDIVSYVLQKKDFINITNRKTDFSERVANLTAIIQDKRLFNKIITMKINGA